ncbi:OmpA family protein [Haloferula sp.]|uniref:OmpA family protein n=1 Tax=Haloferula sp. TaxID=2497595 RepID=UPI00329D706F
MNRSQWPLLLAALVFGGGVTLLFLLRNANPEPAPEQLDPPSIDRSVVVEDPVEMPDPIPALAPDPVDTPSDPLANLEVPAEGFRSSNPSEVVDKISKALAAGDIASFSRLLGPETLTPEAKQRLAGLASSGKLKLRQPNSSGEVGELELNQRTRWALYLDGAEPGRDRIFLDLEKDKGKWGVTKLVLPPAAGDTIPKAQLVDSLGIVDAFLQAALRQEFELAKEFVDSSVISDAKIAGLCILFEEGEYSLRQQKPLRAMFQRGDTAGFLAHVEASDGSSAAQFSVTARQSPEDKNWFLIEINLDQLLADYARRVAGGDVYYTPLVKNPKGGDTLVLYFDFDQGGLTERTERQLQIVAEILQTDPDKKLTISGHTDALGTEDYNNQLSSERASSVLETLVRLGVKKDQIITVAKGQTQPRRPNFTESGADNPAGRRANRRTEIYLDF